MVLGIDPGLKSCAASVINKTKKGTFILKESFFINDFPKNSSDEEILLYIYNYLQKIIIKYKIEVISYETIFHHSNRAFGSAPVQNVIGIIKLLSAQNNIKIISFTPQQIKKGVTGSGKAEKIDVAIKAFEYINKDFISLEIKNRRVNYTPEELIKKKKDHISDSIAAGLSVFLYSPPIKKKEEKKKNV